MNQLIITVFWFRANDAASPVSDTVFITLYLLELWTLTFIIVIILNNGWNVAAISFPSEGTAASVIRKMTRIQIQIRF